MNRRSGHGSLEQAHERDDPCDEACPECLKMACRICFNQGCTNDEEQNSNSDEIAICTTAWDSGRAVIPCKARDHFNSLVGSKVEMVTSEGLPYTMDVVKKPDKTYIEGEWPLFLSVYNLAHPDTVKLVYKHKMKGFHIKPYDPRGWLKLADRKDGVDLILGGCMYTWRMEKISETEKDRLVDMLIEIEQPALRPLIHRLTPTNIYKGELKLQRKFANLLNLEGSGYISFSLGFDEASTPIEYNVSTDGRAVCRWMDFVQAWELDVADLAVFQPYFDASRPCIKVFIP